MLAASEFRGVTIKENVLGGVLCAQLDFVEQGHGTTAEMGVVNEEIFAFFAGEIRLFKLDSCRIVDYVLISSCCSRFVVNSGGVFIV